MDSLSSEKSKSSRMVKVKRMAKSQSITNDEQSMSRSAKSRYYHMREVKVFKKVTKKVKTRKGPKVKSIYSGSSSCKSTSIDLVDHEKKDVSAPNSNIDFTWKMVPGQLGSDEILQVKSIVTNPKDVPVNNATSHGDLRVCTSRTYSCPFRGTFVQSKLFMIVISLLVLACAILVALYVRTRG
ncbi:hypothetical protein RDWZM_007030 [Blomia tropicalis]|uniref:Uncharacterized protein n=1 Tax=Blomia tropicalis TaxID=40697 RepID=A0A9Q0M9L8_BLOTA|nr:hypothetical protein RDWZM_007030 [Blomia tropicalis]